MTWNWARGVHGGFHWLSDHSTDLLQCSTLCYILLNTFHFHWFSVISCVMSAVFCSRQSVWWKIYMLGGTLPRGSMAGRAERWNLLLQGLIYLSLSHRLLHKQSYSSHASNKLLDTTLTPTTTIKVNLDHRSTRTQNGQLIHKIGQFVHKMDQNFNFSSVYELT